MEKSFYSSSWYRVADLKPRLRSHARIHRQHYRGQLWYVLQDPASGRFHRITPAAYFIVSLMNGNRAVREVWEIACRRLGDDVLTQDETIRLLSQLHQVDVLHADVPPDIGEVSARATKVQQRKLAMSLLNPMAVRLPLLDPDAFLNATMPFVRPVFSWVGGCLIAAVVGYALLLTALHWSQLTDNILDRILVAKSLVLLIVTYPIVKAFHELGHAYALKRWGGEVHELGVMFLVFMPVPYVDASSASAFGNKWHRVLVGSAGIIVELLLASLSLFVWLDVEEGLLRAFVFNVMLIGGISTVLFNGNPLLRFDGYYILMDLLEIPNLADRAKRYIGYLLLRYVFGLKDATSPVTAPGEPFWFVTFGIASFIYRIFVVSLIVLVVAGKFLIIGVLLAIWSGIMMIGMPLVKSVRFLLNNAALGRQRGRAIAICAGGLLATILFLLFLPLPYWATAEGVVWAPGEASVFAGAEGTVTALLIQPNTLVVRDQPLIAMEDPLLDAQVHVLEASVKELELRRASVSGTDPLQKQLFEEQLNRAKGDLELHLKRKADLIIRSPGNGRFIVRGSADLIGKFARKGEILAFVADFDHPVAEVVVTEDAADLVRSRTQTIQMRLVDSIKSIHSGALLREVPNVNDRLPSLALSTVGGGEIVMDPRDPKNLKALTKVLHLEVDFQPPVPVSEIGGRLYVRFDLGNEPLAWRLYRDVRQLFLRRFNV
jgi:putative peptide zinc metalloprotease protein